MSDVGRVRAKNEDAFLLDADAGLFVVADGMGGHAGGQAASQLAVRTVAHSIAAHAGELEAAAAHEPLEEAAAAQLLANAVRAACAAIFAQALATPELQGMGTTCTAVLARGGRAFVAHVGDSRCYLQRAGRIVQVTDDHSLVNEQLKAGQLSPEQARHSRLKNIITRSVGFERDVAVDTLALPVAAGDALLLCSDGLSNFVEDGEIGQALQDEPLSAVPERLIALANARGGDDNITVVCLRAGATGAAA